MHPRLPWLLAAATLFSAPVGGETLKICADPNYLPFSNRAGRGFENEIAQIVAKYLGDDVQYTWSSYRGPEGTEQALGQALGSGECDLVMHLPYDSSVASTTRPYYVLSYVFIFERERGYSLSNLDSPLLQHVKLGFERNTPPEEGLRQRGLEADATPFDMDARPFRSPRELLDAVREGQVDVMIASQPAVGQFLPDYPDLEALPVQDEWNLDSPEYYSFPMSMAVRGDDPLLGARINAVIRDHWQELRTLLQRHGVAFYKRSIALRPKADQAQSTSPDGPL